MNARLPVGSGAFLCYNTQKDEAGGWNMKFRRDMLTKDGAALTLRSLHAQDAQTMIRVCRQVAGETLNMMRYADEWTISPEKQAETILKAEQGEKELLMGAFTAEGLAGIANMRPVHPGDRARHRAGVGIAVLKAHWGRGIGTALMQTLIDAAGQTALEQLELDVVSTNSRAIRLYEHFGFEAFGRHPRMMKYRDDTYADTILMALDLRRTR